MSKLTSDEIRAIAESKGIDVLNVEEYVRLDEANMRCQCKAEGHKFITSVQTMRLNSFSCPLCSRQVVNYVAAPPQKSGYRIMGWDQATQHFGISVYDDGKLVYFDCFDFSGDTDFRFGQIFKFVTQVIEEWKPDFVCFEDIQLQTNGSSVQQFQTFKVLAQLMGIVKAALLSHNIPYACVMNKIWQAQFSIAGSDRATQKRNVVRKVNTMFGITVNDDIADAILIGKYACMKKTPRITGELF